VDDILNDFFKSFFELITRGNKVPEIKVTFYLRLKGRSYAKRKGSSNPKGYLGPKRRTDLVRFPLPLKMTSFLILQDLKICCKLLF